MESKEVEETIKTILSNLSSKSISLKQVFTYHANLREKVVNELQNTDEKNGFWSRDRMMVS